LSRPFPSRSSGPPGPYVRINGKIRAREVRVIAGDGKQLGVIPLAEAINMARAQGVDLVEVAANAVPPVCRLVDYGKYRYEQSKKDKEAKKHQHANKVKEIQLSASIDAHDYGVKLSHAIDFACEDMKVKVSLRFRGREMAHTEFGFQVVNRFISDLAPFAHADTAPKLVGRSINLIFTPLPRNKRAKNPNQNPSTEGASPASAATSSGPVAKPAPAPSAKAAPSQSPAKSQGPAFVNNPFDKIEAGEAPA
jgi:translation initiation factor IF-3